MFWFMIYFAMVCVISALAIVVLLAILTLIDRFSEQKKTYYCDKCGCSIELSQNEFDGICPRCHNHHGFYEVKE